MATGAEHRSHEASRVPSSRVDWGAWHASYDKPETPLSLRLEVVQGLLREHLDAAPPGPIRAISICAGQGHDLIGVLEGHPRRNDVDALLVELDEGNVASARASAAGAGLSSVQVLEADAARSDSYADAVPAGLVLACGVFGNISIEDVHRTIAALPSLCSAGATVLWTRHRNPPDLVPEVLASFERAGFENVALREAPHLAVGASVLRRPPDPFRAGITMFEFIGQGALWPHLAPQRRRALQALFRPDCSAAELVEAMRALPAGGAPGQTAEQMLREGRGTSAAKHLFLTEVLAQRFPATRPALVHRVHRLDRERASALYGERVAAAVPRDGLTDVHRYMTLELGGERVALDVTVAGEPWDGHSPLPPACGPGRDVPVLGDPDAELCALILECCEPGEREPFVRALAGAGTPLRSS